MNWSWLNPKAWIVGALKRTAAGIVNAEAPALAARVKLEIEEKGPEAIDKLIDSAQEKMIVAVKTWGPTWAFLEAPRAAAAAAIQKFGDQVQDELDAEVKAHGADAVDLVIKKATDKLIEEIAKIGA